MNMKGTRTGSFCHWAVLYLTIKVKMLLPQFKNMFGSVGHRPRDNNDYISTKEGHHRCCQWWPLPTSRQFHTILWINLHQTFYTFCRIEVNKSWFVQNKLFLKQQLSQELVPCIGLLSYKAPLPLCYATSPIPRAPPLAPGRILLICTTISNCPTNLTYILIIRGHRF